MAASTRFPMVRGSAIDGPGWSAGDAKTLLRINTLEVVARDGIEPSTRGSSVAPLHQAQELIVVLNMPFRS